LALPIYSSLYILTNQQTSINMSSNTDKSKITGTEAAAKDAGFSGFKAFLESYGLRLHNDDDVQEGRAILRGMGYSV
jgi:hypothetical protein